MKKIFLVALLGFLLQLSVNAKEEVKINKKSQISKPASSKGSSKKNEGLSYWLSRMKKRVASHQSQRNRLVAVGAVRGDEKTDPTPLYWKAKKNQAQLNEVEIRSFDEAIELALSGDVVNSQTKLHQFIETFPNSPLIPEAKETLVKLESGSEE